MSCKWFAPKNRWLRNCSVSPQPKHQVRGRTNHARKHLGPRPTTPIMQGKPHTNGHQPWDVKNEYIAKTWECSHPNLDASPQCIWTHSKFRTDLARSAWKRKNALRRRWGGTPETTQTPYSLQFSWGGLGCHFIDTSGLTPLRQYSLKTKNLSAVHMKWPPPT